MLLNLGTVILSDTSAVFWVQVDSLSSFHSPL